MSMDTKLDIGLGVGLGVPLSLAIITIFWVTCRRRRMAFSPPVTMTSAARPSQSHRSLLLKQGQGHYFDNQAYTGDTVNVAGSASPFVSQGRVSRSTFGVMNENQGSTRDVRVSVDNGLHGYGEPEAKRNQYKDAQLAVKDTAV